MAKADKSDTSNDKDKAVEPKISDDVVDAEIVEDTPVAAEAETAEDVTAEETSPETAEDSVEAEQAEDTAADAETSDVSDADDAPVTEDSVSAPEEVDSADESAEPDATPAAPPPAPKNAPEKKTGFVPVALGGVVAAALGFGVAQYVGPMGAGDNEALINLQSSLTAQSEQIATLQSQLQESQSTLEDVFAANDTLSVQLEGLTGSVAAVNGRIDDASGALAKLDGRIAVLEKNPITQSLPSAAIEAYEREVEELKAAVAEQRAEAASMEENAKLTAQQALARAALSRVFSALESGAPYRAALTDFSAATGTTGPAALEGYADTGVPSLAALQSTFPDAARKALAAARGGSEPDSNKVMSFLKTQLGARSVTPQEGDDADAVLSRAEAALRAGRIGDSLAELDALSEAAKDAMSDWIAEAEARQAALVAGESLSQELNTN
ncbi:hypothetical protein [Cognatishimia maritima]|uniref:hypothetical protein n=1 Tax=Cognatishimia maritima TaxID=870908 RepID=UPI000A5F7947|nr:hypothetical protein [Cognatishimia maritima]